MEKVLVMDRFLNCGRHCLLLLRLFFRPVRCLPVTGAVVTRDHLKLFGQWTGADTDH